MEKRYQVFVSSTFADLEDERDEVMRTLMEMDCIPAGMELFPAADEEQFEFIKKIINDCDYYVLIIGGRYGSISETGVSYTEMEYDYAVSKNIKVIALLHASPDNIPVGKTDNDRDLRIKLEAFKEKVRTGRLVKFWGSPGELPGIVSLSLTKTMKLYPAIGWVRANQLTSEDALRELNELRKENAALRAEASKSEMEKLRALNVEGLADFDSTYTFKLEYMTLQGKAELDAYPMTWKQIFSIAAPYIDGGGSEDECSGVIAKEAADQVSFEYITAAVDEQDMKTIGIQLSAYGLIEMVRRAGRMYWKLTERGRKIMMESRVIREAPASTGD